MAVAHVKSIFPKQLLKKVASQTERNERNMRLPYLPEPYQKFYSEWKDHEDKAAIIHWVPRDEHWIRNPDTGEIKRVENRPIPVLYPDQIHVGIWGGCGIVRGMVKKKKRQRPTPWFWVPGLVNTVVYSEILNKHLSVVVTKRALELIDQNYGLDAYLLSNPAYELKSLLALKLKRKILEALANKDFCHEDLARQTKLYEKYQKHLMPPEELEWYGLSVQEAMAKHEAELEKKKQMEIAPLKFQFRKDLIARLQEEKSRPPPEPTADEVKAASWMSRLNPFSKPSTVMHEEGKAKRTNS